MNSNIDKDMQTHELVLISRRELKISGVKQILNFDDTNVGFITVCGELDIDGNELNIDSLDLDKGSASVTGNIAGINYISDQPAKKRKFRGWL